LLSDVRLLLYGGCARGHIACVFFHGGWKSNGCLEDVNGREGRLILLFMMIMSSYGMLGPRGGACGGATVPVAKVKVQLGRKFVVSAWARGGGSLRLRLCL